LLYCLCVDRHQQLFLVDNDSSISIRFCTRQSKIRVPFRATE
jgi:hypothetical protein